MNVLSEDISVSTRGYCDIIDITPQVRQKIKSSGIKNGIVTLFVPGSTGAITTIEYESGVINYLKQTSKKLFRKSVKYFPGGVNSPVRAYRSVGSTPIFIKKAKGSKIFDVDGNQYIDYVCSFGPLILGHSHPDIIKAITKAASNGISFGACTEYEIKLASIIKKSMPS